MENYSYQSYPDSGESSPRSREIDFENPPTPIPWEEQQQHQQQQHQQQSSNNYKAKFMCSYGGKIQPRTHDNQLSYVGGETKILAVDRTIKFSSMISKLCSLIEAPDVSFKYQLPGEDLDALISVTNDDDLDHMMHEYDRLYRASARPARMRLFLFVNDSDSVSNSSNSNSNPPDPVKGSNVDYLFGIEKVALAPPVVAPVPARVPEPVSAPPEYVLRPGLNLNPSDRVIGSDPGLDIQRQLQRMQIAENEQNAYRRKSEENHLVGNYPPGDYYVQKTTPEKFPMTNFTPPPPPPQQQHHTGYWQEKPVSGEAYPPVAPGGGDQPQPVYMVPAPGNYYHAPVMRPPVSQGYYAVQRMSSEGYREAQVYGGAPPSKAPPGVSATYAAAQPVKGPAYAEGVSVVRSTGLPDNTPGSNSYAQVAYDSASGRQVYYNTPGGVVHPPPYQGVAAPVTTDVKVMSKISQGSV
ncbi:leucine-rich repeat extensin-like protein 2 [Vicia villosa]|uniref:leucine-rich repeat extensin-like protein 2 n=1 Tax=Vicia villosa TaxID=3911 RepID=UPI00273C84EE|nr:leucine-rich repeat extensin-like protein 2 [Vicia villosa]